MVSDANVSDNRRWTWPARTIAALLRAGLFANSYAACRALAKSVTIDPATERDVIFEWARRYREARVSGMMPDQAAQAADELSVGVVT